MTNLLKEKIHLPTDDSIMKLHLIIKSYEKGFRLSEADIDSLIELNKTGYNDQFFTNCVSKGYYRSEQTVRNAIAKFGKLGVVSRKKRGERTINKEYMPDTINGKVIVQYLIGNL